MMVIHHCSRDQLDVLFRAVAKPVPHGGSDPGIADAIDWVAPAWWYLMYAMATR